MFCPNCGSEERQLNQFCRVCGVDLRVVRIGLEKPDAITASAISARDEVGHAVAERIRELTTAEDLKEVTRHVLPEIEKFLESPQERRLRRMREGTITAAIGLGATFMFYLLSLSDYHSTFLIGAGVVTFLIGLGMIINGLLFTVTERNAPKQLRGSDTFDQPQESVTAGHAPVPTAPQLKPPSVVEQTTRHLSSEPLKTPALRDNR
ncbi:MAG: hypothetical protein WBP93_07695 [Pyrinomonadaceae bacterium]